MFSKTKSRTLDDRLIFALDWPPESVCPLSPPDADGVVTDGVVADGLVSVEPLEAGGGWSQVGIAFPSTKGMMDG